MKNLIIVRATGRETMDLGRALRHYLTHSLNKNLAESTIASYKGELNRFFLFLEEEDVKSVEEIDSFHIEDYAACLIKSGNTSVTRRRKQAIIKGFFDYFVKKEIITKNPCAILPKVKIKDVEKKKKDVLTFKETNKLITNIEKNSRHKEKNKLLVTIFVYCGLRVGEIRVLKWDDIDWKGKTLVIRGKGGKEREVPIFDDIIEMLKSYKKIKKLKTEFIFTVKNTEKQMSERSILDLIKTHSTRANIKKNIGCHALRRTAATNFLLADVKLPYIQMFLGHSNISTTMEYVKPGEREKNEALHEAYKLIKKKVKVNRS